MLTTFEERKLMGELIKKKRKANKFTQSDIAKILGVGKWTISDYEKGQIIVIPFDKRIKLADILNIPISQLLYSAECDTSSWEAKHEWGHRILEFIWLNGKASKDEAEWTQEDDLLYNAPTQENLFCKKFIAGTEKMTFCNAAYAIFVKAKDENVENVQRIFEILLRLHKVPFRDAQGLSFVFARLYEMYRNTPNGENLDFIQELKIDRGI